MVRNSVDVMIYDVDSAKSLQRLMHDKDLLPFDVTFSPSGKRLAARCWTTDGFKERGLNYKVAVWDLSKD
jgi:hypothetical protein